MIIFADAHLGVDRRNKILYRESLSSFMYIVKQFANTFIKPVEHIFNLGDLWDVATPKPIEYILVQHCIKETAKIQQFKEIHWHGISGNHDLILQDKSYAWSVVKQYETDNTKIHSYNSSTEVIIGKHKIFVVPYSVGMLDEIKDYRGDAKILFSHFSTYQMNKFAGIVDENDPMFMKFDLVLTGDTHTHYDKGKFHTCGSMFCGKVDEMISPICIPAYIYIDEDSTDINKSFQRITFPELKPALINNVEEALHDNKLYVMITDEIINKPNVFCKRLKSDNEEENSVDFSIGENGQIQNITFETLVNNSYTEMAEEKRKKLILFCNKQIDIDMLIGLKEETTTEPIIQEAPKQIITTSDVLEDLL